jgi:hypothetical protein
MKYIGILLVGFIIFLVAAAGCVEPDTPSGTTMSVSTTSTPDLTIAITTAPPSGLTPGQIPGQISGGNTSAPAPDVTITPVPSQDILDLKENYLFGNGTTWNSEATVYRIWINDTYRWFSPDDNQYYTKVAPAGKKYLFVFLSMVCKGTDRAPLPQQNNIYVLYDNAIISPDPTHALPTKYPDSSPKVVRIGEIEFSKNRFNTELIEDFGYSHGQRLGYINPGESNAVDGYVIFEVPASLEPENAYISIVMPQSDTAIWKLG